MNRRPRPYQGRALPTELQGPGYDCQRGEFGLYLFWRQYFFFDFFLEEDF